MKTKSLRCGCCGTSFQTWPEYVDQDQDKGFGICKPCQESIEDRNTEEMSEIISEVSKSLKPHNREQFLSYDRSFQESIVLKMIDDGIITFSIKRT